MKNLSVLWLCLNLKILLNAQSTAKIRYKPWLILNNEIQTEMRTGTRTLRTDNVDSLKAGTVMGLDDGIIVPENFALFLKYRCGIELTLFCVHFSVPSSVLEVSTLYEKIVHTLNDENYLSSFEIRDFFLIFSSA